jgi:hypothetical protein
MVIALCEDPTMAEGDEMTSLDHWNFKDLFTGAEAACLIVGVDPRKPNAETYKSDHLLIRLKAAYSLAIKSDAIEGVGPMLFYPRAIYEFKEELVLPLSEQAEPLPPALQKEVASKQIIGVTHAIGAANNNLQEEDGIWLDLSWPPMSPDPAALQSTAILEIRSEVFPEDLSMDFSYGPPLEGPTPEEWLASKDSSFEEQTFSRQELHRWLQVVGFESAYCFGSSSMAQTSSIEKSSAKMTNLPWPAHDTKNLSALRAAAFIWEKEYKKGDDTTAPTNEKISRFLQAEHRIAPTLADSMATILRADELKTGPRTGPKK